MSGLLSASSLHRSLFVLGRLIFGGIFVWFALEKLFEPSAYFEKAILEYQLLPDAFAPLMAAVLPWAELGLGLFVLLGWWFRPSVKVLMLLLLVFIVAIGSTTLRGIPLESCGCSGSTFNLGTLPHEVVIKDILLLGIGWFLLKTRVRPWMLDSKS